MPAISSRTEAVDRLHAATALYTADPVVSELLDAVSWPGRGGRLLDPGAGDGSFLVAALQRLSPRHGDFDAVRRVAGVEIHPGAALAARERVAGLLGALGWP